MGFTGTDIFGAKFTQIAGIIRAGEAEIEFTKTDGTTQKLAALNVTVTYTQTPEQRVLPGGKLLIILKPSTGGVQIGALLGVDLQEFLVYYGDPQYLDVNKLIIRLTSDLVTGSPSIETEVDALEGATLSCYNVLVNTSTFINKVVEGTLISTNVALWVGSVTYGETGQAGS